MRTISSARAVPGARSSSAKTRPLVSWFRSSPNINIKLQANFETKTTLESIIASVRRFRNSLGTGYGDHANFGIGTLDIDHLDGHAAVQDQVLAGHEARILGDEPAGLGDVFGHADPAHRMLLKVGFGMMRRLRLAGLLPVGGFDPARADAVHPDVMFRQADRHAMGQGD